MMVVGTERMIGVAGATSTIAREFCKLLNDGWLPVCDRLNELHPGLERYLVCTGYLAGKSIRELSPEEADLTWRRNFVDVARFCDLAFAANPATRICVLGSLSGIRGSYDMAYAGAKAALHLYVRTKQLHASQQLVAIAPGIVMDTAMTQRRKDLAAVDARAAGTRRGRYLSAAEVAAQAYNALFIDTGFLSGTVVELGADA
jgi:NAD(P)-dependent dehydrogenase (short-subunit alcohol dehydrogenase family)